MQENDRTTVDKAKPRVSIDGRRSSLEGRRALKSLESQSTELGDELKRITKEK